MAAAKEPNRHRPDGPIAGLLCLQICIRYRVEWYPGTHHGFVFPKREGVYDKPSAERHWERLHALFARNL